VSSVFIWEVSGLELGRPTSFSNVPRSIFSAIDLFIISIRSSLFRVFSTSSGLKMPFMYLLSLDLKSDDLPAEFNFFDLQYFIRSYFFRT